jgi:hypothetical protein
MYHVHPFVWVRVSTMHFTGVVARWFQSMEQRISAADWPTFCAMIHERFSRDQHELLLRQLFNIRHTSTIIDYTDRFVAIVEQLSSYTTNPDPLYFTTRFINGLRDDIHSVILIQRPLNLDAACTLALL